MRKIVACSLALVLLVSATDPSRPIFEDAVAVWSFADLADQAGVNSGLRAHGNVSLVDLEGNEAVMSKKRGGEGRAARFSGTSWLDAGQGVNDELNLSGKLITLYARVQANAVTDYAPVLTKSGNDQNLAYSIAFNRIGEAVYIEAKIGSDEIAGAHLLRYEVPAAELNAWHDVVFRFNGERSELYINGQLRDDEVTVGQIRDWNLRPLLIGAQYKKAYGYADVTQEDVEATFEGLIDIVALWNKSLPDDRIMELSQVSELADGRPAYYTEKYRPQFHFTAKKNWLNDPNGLVYYDGVYHLFFQYMPPHRPGAYKDWGHAISKDLVHWEQVPNHITPHKVWSGCWSGSAVVDVNNVAGFQTGEEKTIIAFITNGGNPGDGLGPLCTQCIAYSTDGGQTFTYYDQNPILTHIKHANRDPKVVWDEKSQKWIMSLFMDEGYEFGLFGSNNLKEWKHLSAFAIDGVRECPGFEPLPLDGDPNNRKWLFFGANGDYVIGSFDGTNFTPETEVLRGDYGVNYYAAMTWSDMPDDRCVSIAWMPTQRYPGMPFEQQMTFPTEVTLRTTADGVKAFRLPVGDIKNLYDQTYSWENQTIEKEHQWEVLDGDQYDMEFDLDVSQSSSFELILSDVTLSYDTKTQSIACSGPAMRNGIIPEDWVAQTAGEVNDRNNLGAAPLKPKDGKINLRILLDRNSIEVFGNGGEVVISSCFMPDEQHDTYGVRTAGKLRLIKADVHSLKSMWEVAN